MSQSRKKRETDSRLDYWIKYCKKTPKMEKYLRNAGAVSEIIWITVLDIAFGKKGWCIEFDDIEDLVDKIIYNKNLDLMKSKHVVIDNPREWVKDCIELMLSSKLISRRMYNKNILTSQSMQLELMKARKRGNKHNNYTTEELFGEFCLLTQEDWEEFSKDSKWKKNNSVKKIAKPKKQEQTNYDSLGDVSQAEIDQIISEFVPQGE